MSRLALVFLFIAGPCAFAADPWHTDLFLPGHDTWHARVPLDLANRSGTDLAGFPVVVGVGGKLAEVPLVGANARSVRVCDAKGVEMLFDLRAPGGERLEDGPIPPGAALAVPFTAVAGQTQRLYVYFDNPQAYLLPEYLSARAQAENGGFEVGEGPTPDDWLFAGGDPQHRMAWVAENPHGGARCVRVDVDRGAEPKWVTLHQTDLPVLPGRRYRITAWVRGDAVEGQAGWYVHVATSDNPQAINRVEKAGDGSFDWRQVTIELTAPDNATALRHGTILYGTGTAWFDDAKVECLDADIGGIEVKVGLVERLELQRIDGESAFLIADGKHWRFRTPIYTLNVGDALDNVLIRAPAASITRRLVRGFNPRSLRVVDPAGRRPISHMILGDELLFRGDLPARCIKEFTAQFDRDPTIPQAGEMGYAALVDSPANLVVNPSFETSNAGWSPMVEGQDSVTADIGLATGGWLGDRCGRLIVKPGESGHWTGWQQDVPVEPGAEYVFTCYVRTEAIADGRVRIHAHLFSADDTRLQIWSGGPDLTGTTDWTLLGGVLRATPETTRVRLFLTMNATGTVYHDAVLFARTIPATVGEFVERNSPDDASLHVWTENPLVKVFQDTPPEVRPERLLLLANRGERESLQLCLRACTDVSATVSVPPPRLGGAQLPPPKIERVGFVPCLIPSNFDRTEAPAWERRKPAAPNRNDGWRGWWPDYLVPTDGAVALSAMRTQPLLITFSVPLDAEPGAYETTVEVVAGDARVRLPLTLRVGKFQLPERPTLQVLFDLSNGPGWSQYDTQEKVEKWWRFMAEHRISANHILPEPEFALADGHVTMNAIEFNRSAEHYFGDLHMAVAYFPGIFYSFGWGHTPRPFLGPKYPSPEYDQAYREAVKLFWEHVKAKGWADRFSLYVSDEPHDRRPEVIENLAHVIRLVRDVDPTIPVYSSTWHHVPAWDGLVNHWGIGQYGCFPLDELKRRQEAGDKIWFTTDGQFELDTPYNGCERLLPYYCFAHDVSGYEFWALAWYTYNPFRFGWYSFLYHSFSADEHSYDRYPNGSGHLAYPGELVGLDGPLSSIRLEQVREGIEDYEMLIALQRLRDERPALHPRIDPVLTEARALAPIPNAGGYRSTEILPDPDALLHVRTKAWRLLEDLSDRM